MAASASASVAAETAVPSAADAPAPMAPPLPEVLLACDVVTHCVREAVGQYAFFRPFGTCANGKPVWDDAGPFAPDVDGRVVAALRDAVRRVAAVLREHDGGEGSGAKGEEEEEEEEDGAAAAAAAAGSASSSVSSSSSSSSSSSAFVLPGDTVSVRARAAVGAACDHLGLLSSCLAAALAGAVEVLLLELRCSAHSPAAVVNPALGIAADMLARLVALQPESVESNRYNLSPQNVRNWRGPFGVSGSVFFIAWLQEADRSWLSCAMQVLLLVAKYAGLDGYDGPEAMRGLPRPGDPLVGELPSLASAPWLEGVDPGVAAACALVNRGVDRPGFPTPRTGLAWEVAADRFKLFPDMLIDGNPAADDLVAEAVFMRAAARRVVVATFAPVDVAVRMLSHTRSELVRPRVRRGAALLYVHGGMDPHVCAPLNVFFGDRVYHSGFRGYVHDSRVFNAPSGAFEICTSIEHELRAAGQWQDERGGDPVLCEHPDVWVPGPTVNRGIAHDPSTAAEASRKIAFGDKNAEALRRESARASVAATKTRWALRRQRGRELWLAMDRRHRCKYGCKPAATRADTGVVRGYILCVLRQYGLQTSLSDQIRREVDVDFSCQYSGIRALIYMDDATLVKFAFDTLGCRADTTNDEGHRRSLLHTPYSGASLRVVLERPEADPNAVCVDYESQDGMSPLLDGLADCNDELVTVLLEVARARLEANGTSAASASSAAAAAAGGPGAGVRRRPRDINLDFGTRSGRTALWFLAGRRKRGEKSLEHCMTLLELGADPNACDGSRRTVLHQAAKRARNPGLLKLLIEKGAVVGAQECQNMWTPAHVAASFGHLENLRVLHDVGGDPLTEDMLLTCFPALRNARDRRVRPMTEEKLKDSVRALRESFGAGGSRMVKAARP